MILNAHLKTSIVLYRQKSTVPANEQCRLWTKIKCISWENQLRWNRKLCL